jgi:hypothetical protein
MSYYNNFHKSYSARAFCEPATHTFPFKAASSPSDPHFPFLSPLSFPLRKTPIGHLKKTKIAHPLLSPSPQHPVCFVSFETEVEASSDADKASIWAALAVLLPRRR